MVDFEYHNTILYTVNYQGEMGDDGEMMEDNGRRWEMMGVILYNISYSLVDILLIRGAFVVHHLAFEVVSWFHAFRGTISLWLSGYCTLR